LEPDPTRLKAVPPRLGRRSLDWLYRASGGLAGLLLVATLLLVVVQMASRLIHVTVPGVQDLAGYGVAATAFLSLAYTLRAGAHVRVNLLLAHLNPATARLFELWCCGLGCLLTVYMAYWSIDLVHDSYEFGEVASGLLSIPLWIPRIAMALGTVVLAIALVDEFVHIVHGGRARYERAMMQTEG
jgi:TRAP-type C4-dicarboxylate transport system permease small subunit